MSLGRSKGVLDSFFAFLTKKTGLKTYIAQPKPKRSSLTFLGFVTLDDLDVNVTKRIGECLEESPTPSASIY